MMPARAPSALTLGLAAVLGAVAALGQPARAQQLTAAISADTVSIESNFTGADLVVFGTIEPERGAATLQGDYDIIIVARGPADDLTVRRKERIAGIWVNSTARHYKRVPSFLSVLSNRPLDEIADPQVLMRHAISLDQIALREAGTTPEDSSVAFREAAVRLMQDRGLYHRDSSAVRFLNPRLFMARMALPATTPVGRYRTEVYLFSQGTLVDVQSVEITVQRGGVEQIVTALATNHPLVYGLLTVLLAVFSGWFASVMFRRE